MDGGVYVNLICECMGDSVLPLPMRRGPISRFWYDGEYTVLAEDHAKELLKAHASYEATENGGHLPRL